MRSMGGGETRQTHVAQLLSVADTNHLTYTVYTAPYTVVWSSVPRSAARYVTTGDRGGSGCTKAGRAQALGVPLNS